MRPDRPRFSRMVPSHHDATFSFVRAVYFVAGCGIAGEGFYLLHLRYHQAGGLTSVDGFVIGGIVLFWLTLAFGDRVLQAVARAWRKARGG